MAQVRAEDVLSGNKQGRLNLWFCQHLDMVAACALGTATSEQRQDFFDKAADAAVGFGIGNPFMPASTIQPALSSAFRYAVNKVAAIQAENFVAGSSIAKLKAVA